MMAPYGNTEDVEKIKSYIQSLNNEEKIGKVLKKLEKIPMTLDLLQKTKVGKAVNKMQSHELYGEDARRIVTKWKQIAKENGVATKIEQPDNYPSSSRDHDEDRERRKRQRSDSPPVVKREIKQEIDDAPCNSKKKPKEEPTLFEQALASSVIKPKPKKNKKDALDISEVDLNYRPLPALAVPSKSAPPPPQEEEFNPEKMFKPRNERGKVFAGRRKVIVHSEVPTLYNMCLRVIGNNIDAIEETGDIPYEILQPVLEKCNDKQLMYIEQRNPYLEDDSAPLWEKFVTKKYPGRQRHKGESWKRAFIRMKGEDEERLKRLSQKIGSSHKATVDNTQRKALLADAKAPRDVRIRQMKNGTTQGAALIPHALDVTKARRQIFETGSKNSLRAIPTAVLSRNSTLGSKSDKKQGPKKGALMMKTMKMLNIKKSR